jgi:hypothetical protein
MDARYLIWLLTNCKVNLNQEANASLVAEIVKAIKILRESVGGETIEHGPQPVPETKTDEPQNA